MRMAPVPLEFVVEVLLRLAAAPVAGIVQVSATEDITYEQAARHIAGRVQAAQSLVQPVTAAASGLSLEHVPAHTTLDTTRLRYGTGLDAAGPVGGGRRGDIVRPLSLSGEG